MKTMNIFLIFGMLNKFETDFDFPPFLLMKIANSWGSIFTW